MDFDITVHADQFSTSGSEVAVRFEAVSADHLEASTDLEIELLAHSHTVAVALPGASIGIGCALLLLESFWTKEHAWLLLLTGIRDLHQWVSS